MNQLKDLSLLVGKTVAAVSDEHDKIIVAFSDKTFAVFDSVGGYYGDHHIELSQDDLNWLEYKSFGIATGYLDAQWVANEEARQQLAKQKDQELRDRIVYERLKRKFDKQ